MPRALNNSITIQRSHGFGISGLTAPPDNYSMSRNI